LGLALPASEAAAADLPAVPPVRVTGPSAAGLSKLVDVGRITRGVDVSNTVVNTMSNTAPVGVEDLDPGRPAVRRGSSSSSSSQQLGLGTARALYAPASFAGSSKSVVLTSAAAAAGGSSYALRISPHSTPPPAAGAAAAAPSLVAVEGNTTPGSRGSSGSTAWPVIQHSPLLDSFDAGDGSSSEGGGRGGAEPREGWALCETWLVTELCDR
jgi:hypothetical protein